VSRKVALLMLAAASAAAPAFRAGGTAPEVVPAGTGIIASPNVTLLATIPDAGAMGARFAGGYYFTNTTDALRIFDVSNPELPTLAGTLPLPNFSNEDMDVSVSRKLVLISHGSEYTANNSGILYVVSWAVPQVPVVVGMLPYPVVRDASGRSVRGPGHTASCIRDCARYAYITGAANGAIYVVDLADPAAPKMAGVVTRASDPAGLPNGSFSGGLIHDVNTDPTGAVWVTGSGGITQLDVRNPLKAKAVRWITKEDNARTNQFIHHNSLRLDGRTLLVTEEDWIRPQCDSGEEDGGFQTWDINPRRTGAGALTFLDEWNSEMGTYLDGGAGATVACSSHWFTFNSRKVVAVGWYQQGVRFLDVSNRRDIRQVGYLLAPGTVASAAYFAPGRDDVVYVADVGRGLDIVKIDRGGAGARTVQAPLRREWLGATLSLRPNPAFGWMCALPEAT
jgi:hypothetical protein